MSDFRIEDGIPYIGDKAYPWASMVIAEPPYNFGGKKAGPVGFQLTFENTHKVSIMWGEGNYCSNRMNYDHDNTAFTVEVAVYAHDKHIVWHDQPIIGWSDYLGWDNLTDDLYEDGHYRTGDVIGWKTAEEVQEIISNVMCWDYQLSIGQLGNMIDRDEYEAIIVNGRK